MVDLDASFFHHLLKLAVADRVSHIPADTPKDHLPFEMATLELDHRLPPHRNRCRRSYTVAVSGEDLRQNRCRRRSSMEGRTRVYTLLVVEAEWTDGNGHYITLKPCPSRPDS